MIFVASVFHSFGATSQTFWFTNGASMPIPSIGAASPYPSTIQLSALPGTISQVKVALDKLQHSYPDDIDILLVNSRTNVMLLSDRGGGNAITNVTLVFDDLATSLVPDSSQINSGTYKPSNDATVDYLPSPAPFPPHGTLLSAFAGASPNDTWSLYVVDDTSGDAGILVGGWRLCITTTNLLASGDPDQADLSVTLTDSRDPGLTEQPMSWLLTIINAGPATATNVLASNTIPAGVQFVSATSSQGSCSQSGGLVTCNLGNLAPGAAATVAMQVIPMSTGTLTVTGGVSCAQTDQAPSNNAARNTTTVNLGPPLITISDTTITELDATRTNAIFNVQLSRPSDTTVKVDYNTSDGTASASSDYYATADTLSFAPGITNLSVGVPVLGDTTVETNEYFYLNLVNAVNALIARGQGRATILNDDGVAGRVNRFQWSSITSPQYQYVPFPVTITALDSAGNRATNFDGAVSFTGLTGTGTNTPRLLITEVDLSSDGIELQNVTSLPLDLSGWRVYFYDWIGWPDPIEIFDFPAGAIAPAGGVLSVRDTGTAPGSYPSFYTAGGISWYNDTTNNQVAVLLVDPAGQPADFFCGVYGYSTEILDPLPISSAQWSGNPGNPNTDPALTFQRTSSTDHNNISDWQLRTNTMGAANSGLAGPFTGPRLVSVSPLISGNFSPGVWSGSVMVNESVTNLYLLARDNDGHAGGTGWFAAQPSTDLAQSQTVTPTSLSVGQNLTFTIRLTNSGPASAQSVVLVDTLPGNVTFKSGTTTQGTLSRSNSTVTVAVGTMPVGGTALITVIATASNPGGATNNATASTSTVDYRASNNQASAGAWINYPPTITAIGNQGMLEDGVLANIPFSIADVETAASAVTVWATSSNPGLVPSANLVLNGTDTSRSLTITPLPNQFGGATITIYAADSQDTSSMQFALNVASVNDPPVLEPIADQVIDEGKMLAIDAIASNVESETETLTFGLVNAPTGASINSGSGRITWTPGESQGPSTNLFTVRVSDNGVPSLSATQSFYVTVAEVNLPPVLGTLASQTVNIPGSLSLQATATDSDLPTNTITFYLVSGPAGLTISPSGLIAWTPPPDFLPATNTVVLRVQDNRIPSLGATGALQVIVNHQPLASSPKVERFAPVAAKVPIQALLGTDSDGDTLTLDSVAATSAQGIPVTRDGAWVYYTPPGSFQANDSFGYTVRDARGATATGTVTLNVATDPNRNPSMTVEDAGSGSFLVRFSGIPGLVYTIEVAASLDSPDWQNIGSATADISGVVKFLDSPPGGTPRNYRIHP